MPATYPNWIPGTTPPVCANAAITRHRRVKSVTVIHVVGGSYRNCQFDGTFELVAPKIDPRILGGQKRAEVYCAWHGVRPDTCFPKVLVGTYTIESKFSGNVADNLSCNLPGHNP
jgi:hypothetical protein